ncbi:MAG: hypothetical protein ACE5K4_09250 [Candidatus Hydrothermarchaeota archaeon]
MVLKNVTFVTLIALLLPVALAQTSILCTDQKASDQRPIVSTMVTLTSDINLEKENITIELSENLYARNFRAYDIDAKRIDIRVLNITPKLLHAERAYSIQLEKLKALQPYILIFELSSIKEDGLYPFFVYDRYNRPNAYFFDYRREIEKLSVKNITPVWKTSIKDGDVKKPPAESNIVNSYLSEGNDTVHYKIVTEGDIEKSLPYSKQFTIWIDADSSNKTGFSLSLMPTSASGEEPPSMGADYMIKIDERDSFRLYKWNKTYFSGLASCSSISWGEKSIEVSIPKTELPITEVSKWTVDIRKSNRTATFLLDYLREKIKRAKVYTKPEVIPPVPFVPMGTVLPLLTMLIFYFLFRKRFWFLLLALMLPAHAISSEGFYPNVYFTVDVTGAGTCHFTGTIVYENNVSFSYITHDRIYLNLGSTNSFAIYDRYGPLKFNVIPEDKGSLIQTSFREPVRHTRRYRYTIETYTKDLINRVSDFDYYLYLKPALNREVFLAEILVKLPEGLILKKASPPPAYQYKEDGKDVFYYKFTSPTNITLRIDYNDELKKIARIQETRKAELKRKQTEKLSYIKEKIPKSIEKNEEEILELEDKLSYIKSPDALHASELLYLSKKMLEDSRKAYSEGEFLRANSFLNSSSVLLTLAENRYSYIERKKEIEEKEPALEYLKSCEERLKEAGDLIKELESVEFLWIKSDKEDMDHLMSLYKRAREYESEARSLYMAHLYSDSKLQAKRAYDYAEITISFAKDDLSSLKDKIRSLKVMVTLALIVFVITIYAIKNYAMMGDEEE